jgi:hypothetical protein
MKNRTKIILLLFIAALFKTYTAQAQDDLMQALEKDNKQNARVPVIATFKGTFLINSRTVETIHKRELDFRVSHRFGDIGGEYGGEKNFFGLENSTDIKISFDYGITDRLTIGLARTKGATAIRQLYEVSGKYKLTRQSADNSMPLTIVLTGNSVITSMQSNQRANVPDRFDKTADRVSFLGQVLIARKFSNKFSLQLTPTFVHTNYVINIDDNDIYALGISGRYKVTRKMALIADYFKVFRSTRSINAFKQNAIDLYNPLGVGLEFETGGHVFDFTFTNSTALLENQFIPYTSTTWNSGQFRWGFNLSRTFAFKKK